MSTSSEQLEERDNAPPLAMLQSVCPNTFPAAMSVPDLA
jgi:hypothetical protein